MTRIEIDGNFHLLKKDSISPIEQNKYLEYRKKWNDYPKKRIVERFPIHLDIEVTSSCNLKCPFCITTYANFKNGLMDYAIYKQIIDEGSKKGLCSIKLNWRGEPLIHPRLCEMISYAKKRGIIDVFLNTNATLLTDSKAKSLIESGLDRIIISFEGYEKTLYESQRVGANYEDTLNKIKNFMLLKKVFNKSLPWVRIQTILIEDLKSKISEYIKFWEKIVDEVACIDLKNEVERIAVEKNEWSCPQIWQRLTIAWDGRIMPCVNDTFGKMCLGTLSEKTVEEAWKSLKLQRMREIHAMGCAHEIEGCLDCPLRSAQALK